MPRNQDRPDVADSFDSKFSHLGAEFPMALDKDMEWYAQRIESASRIYRAAERKNEPELNLKRKKKELYEAIENMFKFVKHLKDTDLEKRLRYIKDVDPTLRKKRRKADSDLFDVNKKITTAVSDKEYQRPRE